MAFVPKKRKDLTALEAEWEARLAGMGMPAELRPLTASSERDGLQIVPMTSKYAEDDDHSGEEWALYANLEAFGGEPTGIADTATAVYWRHFGQAIHALPKDYAVRDRKFLERLSDSGNVNAVRLTFAGMSEPTAYRILSRFAAFRKANKC